MHFDFIGVNMLHGPGHRSPTGGGQPVAGSGAALRRAYPTTEEADKVRRAGSHHQWIMGPGGTPRSAHPPEAAAGDLIWPTLIPQSFVEQTEILVAS